MGLNTLGVGKLCEGTAGKRRKIYHRVTETQRKDDEDFLKSRRYEGGWPTWDEGAASGAHGALVCAERRAVAFVILAAEMDQGI